MTSSVGCMCVLSLCFVSYVQTDLQFSFGLRKSSFEDMYVSYNEIISKKTRSKLACFVSCVNNPPCKSISYNTENGVCQHFLDVFVDMDVSGKEQTGWQHYDGIIRLISFNKPIVQSTYYWDSNCDPAFGTDGLIDKNEVVATQWESEPYAWIDLQGIYKIVEVQIFNRVVCCGRRLKNLYIFVGRTAEKENKNLCGNYMGPGYNGQVLKLKCETPLMGSKVLLVLKASNSNQLLNFRELEVYGL